jgi:predicted transcriptional regulator
MKLTETLSRQLVARLNRHDLSGYLQVALVMPWANLEEALAQVNVDDLSPEAVRVFLDLLSPTQVRPITFWML